MFLALCENLNLERMKMVQRASNGEYENSVDVAIESSPLMDSLLITQCRLTKQGLQKFTSGNSNGNV